MRKIEKTKGAWSSLGGPRKEERGGGDREDEWGLENDVNGASSMYRAIRWV